MRPDPAKNSGPQSATETPGALFVMGAPMPQDAAQRLGAKGEALARLAAIAPTLCAPAVVIEAEAVERLGLLDAETLRVELSKLINSASTVEPRLARGPWTLRLSPVATLRALVPAHMNIGAETDDAARDIVEAAAQMLSAWSGPRAQRRRTVLGAQPGCALIIQRHIEPDAFFGNLCLFDRETGAVSDAPSADQSEIAIEAATAAENAMQRPLETDVAIVDNLPLVLGVRPFPGSAIAMVASCVSMAQSGRISTDAALLAVPADRIEDLLHARVAARTDQPVLACGLAASPGAAAGRLAFDSDQAAAFAKNGEPAILAKTETTPEDVHGMSAAAGVLTLRGGLTSHAAVVARGLGLPAIVGAADLRFENDDNILRLRAPDGRLLEHGDWITLDAARGRALEGRADILQGAPTGAFQTLMSWADARRRMRVRVNADTPPELESAARMGLDGVGLCRTEHMFFGGERISTMRRMIMADDEAERREALEQLLPMQRVDFESIFELVVRSAGDRAPATIRLLDPPLHEFLPRDARGVSALAQLLRASPEKISRRVRELREDNPMLGKRGCRVGVAYPEIYEMQARAILDAALTVGRRMSAELGRQITPRIEIMIPLISAARELDLLKARIDAVAETVAQERGAKPDYCVGVMIETPRAALRADAIAPLSSFFSIGTNDLTQMTYGLSRDDAGRLMRTYVDRGVFEADPFASLDQEGVGELIKLGVERGRAANPGLMIGMCGEHGGDPATIDFCERAGFDYVSCSPFRTPIARLASAQAAIRAESEAITAS